MKIDRRMTAGLFELVVTKEELEAILDGLHCDVSEGLNPIDTDAMIKEIEKYLDETQ